MPKQWKLISLYMILAYITFLVCIHVAKTQVEREELTMQNKAKQSE